MFVDLWIYKYTKYLIESGKVWKLQFGITAGFCEGVKNAVNKAKEILDREKEVYCLGELVHNADVVAKLEKKGLITINKIEDAGIINEVIGFMDYVKNRKVDLDIVILIDEVQKQYGPMYTYVKSRIDRAVYMEYTKGDIYVLNVKNLTKQEITLLSFLSKRYIQDINEFLTVSEDDDTALELVEKKEESSEEEDV